MSRIGKKPILIPAGVEVTLDSDRVSIKGPKGTLQATLHSHVTASMGESDGKKAVVITISDQELKSDRALWGLFRSIVQNMVLGVTVGFEKKLEINGIGFKAQVSPKAVMLDVGYSHEVNFTLPSGITAALEKNILTISGIDKQLVGEVAAQLRRVRKPEPYKGTGIRYVDEVVLRKAGKAATKTAA